MSFLSVFALILTGCLSVFICVQFITKEKRESKKNNENAKNEDCLSPRIKSDNYDRYLIKKYIIPRASQDNKIIEFRHGKDER